MTGDTKGSLTTVDGKRLGVLKDFVVDLAAGRIVDIITALSTSHSASDDHLVAIPWEIVQWKAPLGTFVFLGDETILQQAPHVARKIWLPQPATQWTAAAHRYWRQSGKLSSLHPQGSRPVLYNAKDLVGIPVHGRDGTDLGMIAEVGLRPEDGLIVYALVFGADPLGSGSPTLFRLPWKVLHLDLSQPIIIATVAEWMDICGSQLNMPDPRRKNFQISLPSCCDATL